MECAGELERVRGELMDTVMLADVVDELRQAERQPDEIELALLGQERDVTAIGSDAALRGSAQDARDARVRVLDVIDRVLI